MIDLDDVRYGKSTRCIIVGPKISDCREHVVCEGANLVRVVWRFAIIDYCATLQLMAFA